MTKFRILHTGDLHLDSPLLALGKLADLRRQEHLDTFAKIIELAKTESVDALVIAGDLFDCANLISTTTLNFVVRKFNEIPNIPVFIALGNHDAGLSATFPDNVHIFNSTIRNINLNDDVDIYGISFEGEYCDACNIEGFVVQNPSKINLVIVHSEVVGNGQTSRYNMITPSVIASTGADYFALGHIHQYSGIKTANSTHYAYCGIPEGRGFDELGARGVIIADIYKNHVDAQFINTCKRQYIQFIIDISACNDYDEICSKICDSAIGQENLYKIILTGETTLYLNTSIITEKIKDNYYFIKVIDETKPKIDLDTLSKEYSLKGLFIKTLLDENGSNNALKYGLAALDGEKVTFE